jgi:hypothetical protein
MTTVTATVCPGLTGTACGSPFCPSSTLLVKGATEFGGAVGQVCGVAVELQREADVPTRVTAAPKLDGTTPEPASVKSPVAIEWTTVRLAEQELLFAGEGQLVEPKLLLKAMGAPGSSM